MGLLSAKMKDDVRARLADLPEPVRILAAVSRLSDRSSTRALEFFSELVELSPQLSLEAVDAGDEPEAAANLGLESLPGAVLVGPDIDRIRFLGVPLGLQLPSLLESLVDVSCGTAEVDIDTRIKLSTLPGPVLIRVFASASCPFCHAPARAAQKLAAAFRQVTAELICVEDCPEMALRWRVRSVPTFLVDGFRLEGARPERAYAEAVDLASRRKV